VPKKIASDESSLKNPIHDKLHPLKTRLTTGKNETKRSVAKTNRNRTILTKNIKRSDFDQENSINHDEKENPFVLDKINLKIIEELISNGDIKSSEISEKLLIPLSTIQRRRTKIEKTILKKHYHIDLTRLGYRTAQIFIDVQRGKAKEVGENMLVKYDKNVIGASTRINSSNNLCLDVVYNGSEELHNLLEEIKSIPVASKVDWSEQVMVIGDNVTKIIKNTLADRLEEFQSLRVVT
jgi:DNA-binding Lrp family transcriptional regulator